MEVLSKVADLVLTPLFNSTRRHIAYLFKAGDNMRDLESATQSLLAKKADLIEKVETAERNGQKRTRQFQGWLEEVDDTKKEADEVVEKYKQKGICFKCFSPGCSSNYSLGKAAAKALLDVRRLSIDERTQELAITPVPPAVEQVPVFTTLASKRYADPNLGTALGYIREDDEAGMIGVWGMGGVGKTRFLKQINNSFFGDSSFDHVIWITVSQSCSIAKVQKQIVKSLKIQKDEDDDNSQSKIISNFLMGKSFLLLLDDVWERIDLQQVGIPQPLGVIGGCKRKAVLTTRSLAVCGQMEVRKPIKRECLRYDDAFNLFLEKVGEETINSHPRIQSLAEDIVKELGGLPLALITIGRAMYQKKEPREWEHAIEQVKKSEVHEFEHSHGNHSEGLFHSLKISYDCLKSDTLRECFLSCSMWPEDELIDTDELISCWMGLGLIEDFGNMSNAYNIGYSLISNLMRACLLEEDDEDDSVVSVHDLLHDMALWIARDNGKSKNKWVVVEDEVPRDKKIWHVADRITIMYTEKEKLPPVVADYPSKLTTLVLKSNHSLKELGDLRAFVALTYLNLSDCVFDKFPIEVCVLVQLQYLNFADNCLTSLPEELESLVNLKFLILKNNDIHIIPQGVIAKLKYLQVLDLFQDSESDSVSDSDSDDELSKASDPDDELSKASDPDDELSKASDPDDETLLPSQLSDPGDELSKASDSHDETPTNLPSHLFEELESLNDFKGLGIYVQGTSHLRRLIELENMPIWCLAISKLNDSTSFSASFLTDKKIQKNLYFLRIMDSNVKQLVIESDHQHPTCCLSKLERFRIDKMDYLEEIIWEGVVPKQLFQGLRSFYLESCDMLKDISWVLHLPLLRNLSVHKCSSMNQLISSEVDDDSTPTFPCLMQIELSTLPELVAICHSAFAFPALSSVDVWECPKLKKLPFQEENIPSKLKIIRGEKEWLNGLELESGVKTRLQTFFDVDDGDEESDDGDDDEESSDGDDESEKANLI